jgi:hypothetical protein
MIGLRNVAISVFGDALSAHPTCSQDLSRYREFQLGTSLPAVIESVRLDKQEAPQREIESRKKKDEENRAKQEKARRANKAPFRP